MGGFNPHITVGPLEGGVIVSSLLFGAVTIQVDVYCRKYPHDRWPLKTLVAFVWLLELAHTVCIMDSLFVMTIKQRGQTIEGTPKSFSAGFFFSGCVGPVVQAFFANRAAKCFDKPHLAILCWTLAVFRFLCSIVMTATSFTRPTIAQFDARWQWVVTTALVNEVCVDLLIATSLCYFLMQNRRLSIHKRTIRLLDRLIAMTVSTGLITSVMAIIILICFLTMPENYLWLALAMCQAKLFSNSMLASLNGRSMLRHDQEQDTEVLPGNSKSNSLIFHRKSVVLTTCINLSSFLTNEVPEDPDSPHQENIHTNKSPEHNLKEHATNVSGIDMSTMADVS
ncbi:hypothetical protein PILCRDRAFT_824240 [Piloderma croceum F 1598]|uniref:DUF6534 domain-containing protein n=1 Tax=Piloderma croceum (strain F 1598) TaxID=765440 RepID=A0A0C3BMW1_PILCF|nr:hypothetical protein PILCRDRAFT_824240 [Piloderma croceum F 1598]